MSKTFLMTGLMASVAFASNALAGGSCGDNCTWDLEDGVLSISGIGLMNNYAKAAAPWYDQKDSITSIDISNGITSIGNYSFQDLNAITSLNIPDSVTIIGQGAFLYMTVENATLTIPNSVTSIGAGAFKGMGGVASLTIPNSVTSIGGGTFMNMNGIVDITIPDTTELRIGIYSPFEGIDLSQVTFHCAGVLEQCKANMAAAGYANGTYTMVQAPYSKKQADGFGGISSSLGEMWSAPASGGQHPYDADSLSLQLF